MRTLALDLAGTTGWAIGGPAGVDASGSRKLPSTGEDVGTYLNAFRGWVHGVLQRHDVKRMVFEAPILHGAQLNIATLRKLYGLAGVTEMVGRDMGVPCFEANLSHIRAHFIHVTRAPVAVPQKDRKKWITERVVAACIARGWHPRDGDEADAMALLDYTLACDAPAFAMKATALFAELEKTP